MSEASSNDDAPARDAFVEAAFWYGSLDAAEEIRRAHPPIPTTTKCRITPRRRTTITRCA
jgi:hypothetical protein